MRAASLFPPLSMLEQTSENSLPDLLISGCSGVLFGPVLAGEPTKPVLAREPTKKIPNSAATRSRRTAASHQSLDSTSDFRYCQQREPPPVICVGDLRRFYGTRLLRPGRFCGTERSRPISSFTS